MSTRSETSQPLMPEHYYHIFNRANGDHNLFFTTDNYYFFLKRLGRYTRDYLDVLSYCLLPNHFHLLVKIKSSDQILEVATRDYSAPPKRLISSINKYIDSISGEHTENLQTEFQMMTALLSYPPDVTARVASFLVAEQLRKCFMSYSKAVNKRLNRRGSLLQKYFRRKLINNQEYLKWLIWYIHRNPMHHCISSEFQTYQWSSYRSVMSEKPTRLARQELLSWFGNSRQEFDTFHNYEEGNWKMLRGIVIE